MTAKKSRISRWKIAIVTSALAFVVAVPAFAADTVQQTVNGGSLSASIADLTMAAVTYSHENQTNTDSMTLTADDSTGTDDGWNVTVQADAFSGASNGDSIGASNFEITTANTPTSTAGQAVDPTGGPRAGVGGTLDAARMVLEADSGFGKGTYDQVLDVSLTIPGQTLADTYTSNLTVTIVSGPST